MLLGLETDTAVIFLKFLQKIICNAGTIKHTRRVRVTFEFGLYCTRIRRGSGVLIPVLSIQVPLILVLECINSNKKIYIYIMITLARSSLVKNEKDI